MRDDETRALTHICNLSLSGVTMHRIDTPTAQADKFGPGKNGFTGGNPQTGRLPTALDQDFFDALQEEIARVIEAAGMALRKDEHSQLLDALNSMFLQRGNHLSEIKAQGPAAVDATLANLGIGDAAKRAIGVEAGQIPDISYFAALKAGIGYQKLPGGVIIQWGINNAGTGGVGGSGNTVNFPIPFPTACLQIVTSYDNGSTQVSAGAANPVDSSTFRLRCSATSGTFAFRWIAMGY